MVLSAAGYGVPLSWDEESIIPKGHELSFSQTLELSASSRLARRVFPKWTRRFSKSVREGWLAEDEMKVPFLVDLTCNFIDEMELKAYLTELIDERQKAADKEDRWDLLTNLVKGGEEEKNGQPLSASELQGCVPFTCHFLSRRCRQS